jgi:hypothetical protein
MFLYLEDADHLYCEMSEQTKYTTIMIQIFLFVETFWFRKTITDPHIFAYLNIKSGYELPKIKNLYPRNAFKEIIVHIISVHNKTLHDLTLIKVSTPRIMCTGCSEISTATVIRNKRIANLNN